MRTRLLLVKIYVSFTIVVVLMAGALPLSAQPPPPIGDYVPGEILVKFKPTVGALGAQNALRAEGLQALEVSPQSGLMRVQVPPGREAETTAALQMRGDVVFAEPNYILTAFDEPDDTGFSEQWALRNTGQFGGIADADIDAPEAWDIYTGGSNIIIAVLDTGVDLDHEDLQSNIWVNQDEIPLNGLDDDHNGFGDDVNGWDFCNSPYNSSSVRCTSPQDNVADDEYGHGSHVAGIAAARGNNGTGVAGINWKAKIMPVKVLDAYGSGTVFSIASGMDYAVANGANVINMSLGAAGTSYPCNGFEAILGAMQNALDNGALVVVAAGNESASSVSCPAAYDQAMAVGSTTFSDTRSYFSNYGSRLDIAAPGGSGYPFDENDIYSTIPGSYGYLAGTSMATPHVSGLAALLWSMSPALTHDQVRDVIQSTADDLGAAGWDQYFGYGRINAWQALSSLVALQVSPTQTNFLVDDDSGPIPALHTIQITTNSPGAINWTASVSPGDDWLSIDSPSSGSVSASSPASLRLTASPPPDYGSYTANVSVTGSTPSGGSFGLAIVQVRISYVPDLYQLRFPILRKNRP